MFLVASERRVPPNEADQAEAGAPSVQSTISDLLVVCSLSTFCLLFACLQSSCVLAEAVPMWPQQLERKTTFPPPLGACARLVIADRARPTCCPSF